MQPSLNFVFGALIVIALAVLVFRLAVSRDRPIATPEQVLGEVDILLAYGRKDRAVRALKSAIQRYPEMQALRMKLREVEGT